MSCRICRGPDSGTTDLCALCEAKQEYEQNLDDEHETGRPWAEGFCFLARFSDKPCSGRMDKAHLLKQQTLRREHVEDVWDPRVWVPACRSHHAAFDVARTIRIPRSDLPVGLERFAEAHGLAYWLEREYGTRREAA